MHLSEEDLDLINRGKHPFVKLAWASVISYVEYGEPLKRSNMPPFLRDELSCVKEELSKRRACFVSLKKKGELRGCIGTVEPEQACLMEEIIQNAIASAVMDLRFPPLRKEELNELGISVDVLSEIEPATIGALDPDEYGILVEQGANRGLLLPALQGVDSPEVQLRIASTKGGIDLSSPFKIYRFTTERYE